MTTEQQRKMLECAAKACGFKKWRVLTSGLFQVSNNENWNEAFAEWTYWDPITNPADCADMCAELEIGTYWLYLNGTVDSVECNCRGCFHECFLEDHDNSRLKAWMYAATMCAAKTRRYE